MFKRTPDVLVVGAGPVGLFSALSPSKAGIPVEIVDTGMWPCAHSYALALQPQTVALFQEIGLWESIANDVYPVTAIGLYDGSQKRGEIRLNDGGMAVLPQDSLEGMLERALGDSGVEVCWRHEASSLVDQGDRVSATIDQYERESRGYVVARTEWVVTRSTDVDVQYVIGADGYNSGVRRAAGIDFPTVGAGQHFAVFEFRTDLDLGHEARIVLGENTTNVLWPLGKGHCRWSFEIPGYQDAESERWKEYRRIYGLPTKRTKDRLMFTDAGHADVLDDARLYRFIAERAPWFRGSVEDINWRTVVQFERRLAASYGKGRMWLAGDAAHLTAPAGIQSLNLGLFEARDLSCTLARVLRGTPVAELDAYNAKWQSEWRRLHGIEGGLQADASTDPWIAEQAGRLLPCLPAYGNVLAPLAKQLGLSML